MPRKATNGTGQKLRAILALGFLAGVSLLGQTPSSNPFPIRNGILQTPLNANGFQIIGLDTSNLALGGGSGNDTGVTTAILKGDGNHGFDDAVAGTDYLTPTGSGLLLTGVVLTANNLSDLADAATGRLNLGLNNVDNTSDANKPVSTAQATAIALKADSSTLTSALALKADAADLTTGLALKEDLLPTSGTDGQILARDADDQWHFVDPVTLGTTSQTFPDGVENSSTTLTSASANFVTGDVGKTITGDNIPSGTTIDSRTNSTTIILSQAATATGSDNEFTILNRLEVGGTGTLTDLTVVNSNSALATLSVINPHTTPQITLSSQTQLPNTFYANGNGFSAVPSFISQSAARNALNLGSMALQNNTGTSVAIQKGNGTGGFSPTVAGTDYLAPGGSGTGLTGVLKTASNLNDIPDKALAKSNLGLSVVASSGSFFDLTAPTVGADTFYGNPNAFTGSATFMTASAAKTALAITEADVANLTTDLALGSSSEMSFSNTLGTTTGAPQLWAPNAGAATMGKESAALTGTRYTLLPFANTYRPGKIITYYDDKTTAAVGRQFRPQGATDTLNGVNTAAWGATWLAPFVAGNISFYPKAVSFKTDGVGAWIALGNGQLDHVEDPANPLRQFVFNAGLQSTAVQGIVNVGPGTTVTVSPTDVAPTPAPGAVVKGISSSGAVTTSAVGALEVEPQTQNIGTPSSNITFPSIAIDNFNPPTVSKVRILGTLTGPLNIAWPSAANYPNSREIVLQDESGSVSPDRAVTITTTLDSFNGQGTIVFDEPFGRRTFSSNGTDTWNVATAKTTLLPFTSKGGPTFTITGNTTAVKHNATFNLASGINTLAVVQPYDGMDIDLTLVQPSGGSPGTLNLPAVSKVEPVPSPAPSPVATVGTVKLSSANSAVDQLHLRFNGALNAFIVDTPKLAFANLAAPGNPTLLSLNAIAGGHQIDLSWTDNASNEQGYQIWRSDAGSGFNQIFTTGGFSGSGTYSDNNVQPLTNYAYFVRAFNSGGTSAASNTPNVTTSSGAATAELFEAFLDEGGTGTDVGLTTPAGGHATLSVARWAVPPGGIGNSSAAAFNATASIAGPGTFTVAPTGGSDNVATYKYRVLAFTASGTHVGTSDVQTLTAGLPTGNSTLSGSRYNLLSFTSVTGGDHYVVYRVTATNALGTGAQTGSIQDATNITGTGTITYQDTGQPVSSSTVLLSGTTDASTLKPNVAIPYTTNSVSTISVSFWIKSALVPTNNASSSTIFNLDNGTGTLISVASGNKLSYTMNGNSGTTMIGTTSTTVTPPGGTPMNDNSHWHNIVVIMDNSGTSAIPSATGNSATAFDNIRVYYDGNNQQTVNFTTVTRTGPKVFPNAISVFGSGNLGSSQIDHPKIFNRAISTSEIDAIAAAGPQ